MTVSSNPKARQADFDRRRAELHRRSKALKAPSRGATEAEERFFVAVLDRLAGGAEAIRAAAAGAPYEALVTIDDIHPDRPDRPGPADLGSDPAA